NFRDSKNRAEAYERKQKYEAIVNMVIRWLDSNIDDYPNEEESEQMIASERISKQLLAEDSSDLKEKIQLALDPKTTKREIEDGDL
ncbi:MAG: hypothetical protein HKN40_03540, partial [Winogradskyella sp.]|uniref:hypothetical protein n=1 Tax=Winogradskyella sp. TaxID=1883156 RepID=UPI001795A8FF|nr:hypothetical protein [Winogradskyella sp.]